MIGTNVLKSVFAAAALAALGSAPAIAGQLTYTSVGPSLTVPRGGVFALQQFNPALGTLTQVDLTWTTSAAINAQVFQDGSAGTGFVDGADVQFTFNAPQVSITQINQPVFSFSWFAGTQSPIDYAPSNSEFESNGQQVNPANWTPYIGLGTFNVDWIIEAFNASAGPVWVGSPGSDIRISDRLGGYNFSVTYNYVPEVPEPGTLALLGLGLAGLGLTRRRKA